MITIHTLAQQGYQPGTIGRCTALMSRFYCAKFGFGAAFESATASALAAFFTRFDARRDGLWLVRRDDEIVGCAAVDGQTGAGPGDAAQFRWFYLAASTRGHGLGVKLLREAIEFARRSGYATLSLSTHPDLQAAVHLYEAHGFRFTGRHAGQHWGRPLALSHYTLALQDPATSSRPRPMGRVAGLPQTSPSFFATGQ